MYWTGFGCYNIHSNKHPLSYKRHLSLYGGKDDQRPSKYLIVCPVVCPKYIDLQTPWAFIIINMVGEVKGESYRLLFSNTSYIEGYTCSVLNFNIFNETYLFFVIEKKFRTCLNFRLQCL